MSTNKNVAVVASGEGIIAVVSDRSAISIEEIRDCGLPTPVFLLFCNNYFTVDSVFGKRVVE
jgi:bisphosphoglycerate-dependent phosphoglycerate mutase